MPFFFNSRRTRENRAYDFPIKSVAHAGPATPTYFEPLQLEMANGRDYCALGEWEVLRIIPQYMLMHKRYQYMRVGMTF
jgi:hypothetical protein